MTPSRSFWQLVDWFIPGDVRWRESDEFRRMRLLVVCAFALIPFTVLGTLELMRGGTLVGAQAHIMMVSTLALVASLVVLKVSRSSTAAGIGFCTYLLWAIFFLAATDVGVRDPILAWAIPIPLMAAFLVGPWLAWTCAAVLIGGIGSMYFLEVSGAYAAPMLSTPEQELWFTFLSTATAVAFAAVLAWLYEGYTVRRLRRMNLELNRLRGELEESETRYRSLFDNLPVGMYQSTPQGRITMANKALLNMLGVPSVIDLAGLNAFSLYENPDERSTLLDQLDELGEVHGVEFPLLRSDGGRVHVRESARAAKDEHGRVLYYEGIIEDVSERWNAERIARDTEERSRALVQHSTDTITIVDEEGFIRYVSPSIQPNLGFEHDEAVGKPMLELVHPEDRRRVAVLFRRGLSRGGRFGTVSFRCRHASGHYIYVEAVVTNMLSNPWVKGIVLNSRDVTERKRSEVALITAKEQAEEIARLKSAFLANMSHEIRTPLTGIIGFAGVLAEEVDDAHREFVALIERSGRRLLQTLNSVLDLARLESNQMEIDARILDVSEHVEDTVMLLQPLARDRGLKLVVEAPRPGPQSKLDAACLSRILNNLVGNALKFTDTGEVRVTVRVDNRAVEIEVRDTGLGIEKAFVPHLFDEFKQESSGLGRKHEGSGLGLTITRRLVELMHGTIFVESAKGEGSTFTVTFPLATSADLASGHPALIEYTRPRILVVDDNDSTLVLMERMLREQADVDVALTPEEALQFAGEGETAHYDVIFLDIHLAGAASGTELMRQLRARKAYRHSRIIAFTAFALPGDRERFLNAGFTDYLGKPFTREQLMDVLQEPDERKHASTITNGGDGSVVLPGAAEPVAEAPAAEDAASDSPTKDTDDTGPDIETVLNRSIFLSSS